MVILLHRRPQFCCLILLRIGHAGMSIIPGAKASGANEIEFRVLAGQTDRIAAI